MSQFVEIEQLDHETLAQELGTNGSKIPENTLVYAIQGPFFFGVAEKMERAFAATHSDPVNIIFRLNNVPFMDITGLQTFSEIIEQFHQRGVTIYLCEANPRVAHKLIMLEITRWIADQRIFATVADSIEHLAKTNSPTKNPGE